VPLFHENLKKRSLRGLQLAISNPCAGPVAALKPPSESGPAPLRPHALATPPHADTWPRSAPPSSPTRCLATPVSILNPTIPEG
jgi:hypothetical protein